MIKAFLSAAPVASEMNYEAADMGIAGAGVTALLGYAVVFFGLVLLMTVIAVFGKIMAGKKKAEKAPVASEAVANADPAVVTKQDTGVKNGARVCDLHNVDDKTAAMIMAIIADETKIPLNELRFISIKEL